MKKIVLIISFLMILCPVLVYAWDGCDYESDRYIEIKDKDSVVPGDDVVIFDHSDGFYHEVYVISVNRNGAVIDEVLGYKMISVHPMLAIRHFITARKDAPMIKSNAIHNPRKGDSV